MSHVDYLDTLLELRRIHRTWAAGIGNEGIKAVANASDYLDAWVDPDWTPATPGEEQEVQRRIEQISSRLDALITQAAANPTSEDPDDRTHWLRHAGPDPYAPPPEVVTLNLDRQIDGFRFLASTYGKVADALLMEHVLSRQLYLREDGRWKRIPDGVRRVFLRYDVFRELEELTVDAVATWDARFFGGYLHRGELTPFRV